MSTLLNVNNRVKTKNMLKIDLIPGLLIKVSDGIMLFIILIRSKVNIIAFLLEFLFRFWLNNGLDLELMKVFLFV